MTESTPSTPSPRGSASPAEAAHPAWPTKTDWTVESQWSDGQWRTWSSARPHAEARAEYDLMVRDDGHRTAYRLVRATTTYAINAVHAPQPADTEDATP